MISGFNPLLKKLKAVKAKSKWFYSKFRSFSSKVYGNKGDRLLRGFLGLISCDRGLWSSITNNGSSSVCVSIIHADGENGVRMAHDPKHCFWLAGHY